MKYLALSVLIGFAAISFFGFGIMGHEGGHATAGCIASVFDGAPCLESGLAMVRGHIGVYEALSQAVSSVFSVSWALILSLLAAALLLFKVFTPPDFASRVLEYFCIDTEPVLNSLSLKLRRWLSLFENSPSI